MIVQAFLFSTYMILSLLLGRYIGSSQLISGQLWLASLGYFSCLLVLIEWSTIDGPCLINDLLCISAPSASSEVCPPASYEVYFHASYEVCPSISYDKFHLVSCECYIQTSYCRSGINELLICDGWDNSIMSRYYAISSSISIHNVHEIYKPNTCHPYGLSDFPYIFMVSVQLGLNICHFLGNVLWLMISVAVAYLEWSSKVLQLISCSLFDMLLFSRTTRQLVLCLCVYSKRHLLQRHDFATIQPIFRKPNYMSYFLLYLIVYMLPSPVNTKAHSTLHSHCPPTNYDHCHKNINLSGTIPTATSFTFTFENSKVCNRMQPGLQLNYLSGGGEHLAKFAANEVFICN